MTSVALPAICSGVYNCWLRDLGDLVTLPNAVFIVIFNVILFYVLWRTESPKQLKSRIWIGIRTALITILTGAFVMVWYTANHQYDNLYQQHQMALQGKATSDAHLKKTKEEIIEHQALEIQLGARIERVEKALERLEAKEEEILRKLLQPKTK